MRNILKRTFAMLLVLVMCFGMIPVVASAATDATLSFASKNQRTSFSASKQVWKQNGITFTNDKASSTSDVADYAAPVRLYAKSKLVIEAPGSITKIVFDCNSSSYATAMKNSAGGTATVSSDKVTVTLDGSSNTYTVSSLTAQIRLDSITVTYEAAGCVHTNQETTITKAATCTTAGLATVSCMNCGEVVRTYEIPASHKYEAVVTLPTATEQGYTTHTCSVCGDTYVDSYTEALGESYTVTFEVPKGVNAPAAMSCNKTGITLPEVGVPAANEGYQFAGWATYIVETTDEEPEMLPAGAKFTATADTTLYAVYSIGGGSDSFVKTALSDIQSTDEVVITMKLSSGAYYALTNGGGTSSAPKATKVTVSNDKLSDDPAANLRWNVGGNSSGYIIYPKGSTTTWLYSTNTNNGTRVGNNTNKTWVLDAASGYLKHTGTSRYLGVYNSQDWRSYTNTTGNTANQTLTFFVKGAGGPATYDSFITNTSCDHADTTVTTVDATCTENGSVTTVCNTCGQTVSMETISATGHQNTTTTTVEATCTTAGSSTVTCDDCGKTVSTEVIPATGHSYEDGACTVCGEEMPDYSGTYYIAAIRSSGNYFYMTGDLGTASTKRYQAEDSGLKTLPETITGGEENKSFTLIVQQDGTYLIQTEEGYLGWTTGNSGLLVEQDKALRLSVDLREDGTYNIYFTNSNEKRYLSLNEQATNNYFAFYTGTQKQNLSLIPVAACTHENTTTTTVDATCTAAGSKTVTCDDCGETISTEVIPATGHSYTDGVCSCGQKAGAMVGDQYYTTVQDAVNAAPEGGFVQLKDYSTEYVTVEKDLYLDLNGFDLDGVIVEEGATLYGVDSTTDDYDCSNGYGTISEYSGSGNVAFEYKTTINGKVRRYVTYEDQGVLSFHRIYVGITSVSLRPGASGMGYKATVAGDEKVIEMMDANAISMAMWVEGNAVNAKTVSMEKEKITKNKMVITARVQGIDVESFGETVLCASISMNLKGKTITSIEAKCSLRQAVEAVATAVANGTVYSNSQMSAIQDFCEKNADAMEGWSIASILNWTSAAQ